MARVDFGGCSPPASRSSCPPTTRRPDWGRPWTSCSATWGGTVRSAGMGRPAPPRCPPMSGCSSWTTAARTVPRPSCGRGRRRSPRSGSAHPRLALLSIPHGGKGAAVRAGMLAADTDLVVFADADMATPPDQVPLLVAALADHDVALGSRIQPDGSDMRASQPPYRRLLGRAFHLLASAWAVGPVQDTQCGFKGFTREAAHDLFARQVITSIVFDVELIYLARRRGYRIAIVPIRWADKRGFADAPGPGACLAGRLGPDAGAAHPPPGAAQAGVMARTTAASRARRERVIGRPCDLRLAAPRRPAAPRDHRAHHHRRRDPGVGRHHARLRLPDVRRGRPPSHGRRPALRPVVLGARARTASSTTRRRSSSRSSRSRPCSPRRLRRSPGSRCSTSRFFSASRSFPSAARCGGPSSCWPACRGRISTR